MVEEVKPTDGYSPSDKLAIALTCLAGVMAIILFLVEKTPHSIVALLLTMVALLAYPVLHFVRRSSIRIGLMVCMVIGTVVFGRSIWPKEQASSSLPPPPARHALVNFLPPIPIADEPLLPFHVGQKPALNVAYENNGDLQMHGSWKEYMRVLAVPAVEADHVFENHLSEMKSRQPIIGGALNPGTGRFYRTFHGDPLTKDQVKGLNHSDTALCVIGVVEWEDNSGRYQTSMDSCLIRQRNGTFPPHSGPNDNVEKVQ